MGMNEDKGFGLGTKGANHMGRVGGLRELVSILLGMIISCWLLWMVGYLW